MELMLRKPKTTKIDMPDYKGYKQFMVYHNNCLDEWYCGYVQLPVNHPLCGINDIDNIKITSLRIHGGITYNEHNVLGFDCMHIDDNIVDCNEEFVRRQLIDLIDQLKELEK